MSAALTLSSAPRRLSAAEESEIPSKVMRRRPWCGRTATMRTSPASRTPPERRRFKPSENLSGKSVSTSTTTSPFRPCGFRICPMTTRSSGPIMRSLPGAPARGRASGGLRDELADGLGGFRALRDPRLRLLAVELEKRRVLRGVVVAELLEDLGGRGAAAVGDDDAVGRGVRAADAAETDLEHVFPFLFLECQPRMR